MNNFVLSVVWTALTAYGSIALYLNGTFANEIWIFRMVFFLMPLVGLYWIYDSLRKLRRFRSVRKTEDGFAWTALDGSAAFSKIDPRMVWDKEDRNFSDN